MNPSLIWNSKRDNQRRSEDFRPSSDIEQYWMPKDFQLVQQFLDPKAVVLVHQSPHDMHMADVVMVALQDDDLPY